MILTQAEYEALLGVADVFSDRGGWRTARTILQCYQRPDEDRLRKALDGYRETECNGR